MYPDVGKEIKKVAKTAVVLMTIPAVLLAIAVFAICATTNDGLYVLLGLAAGAGIISVGYFSAKMAMMLLYGYGELIDEVKEIRQTVNPRKNSRKKTDRKPSMNPNDEPAPANEPSVSRNEDGSWTCLFCDHINAPNAKSCTQCHTVAHFE